MLVNFIIGTLICGRRILDYKRLSILAPRSRLLPTVSVHIKILANFYLTIILEEKIIGC